MTDLVAVSAPICSSPPFLYQNRRPVITQSGCGLARPWSHRRSTLSPRRTPPAAVRLPLRLPLLMHSAHMLEVSSFFQVIAHGRQGYIRCKSKRTMSTNDSVHDWLDGHASGGGWRDVC